MTRARPMEPPPRTVPATRPGVDRRALPLSRIRLGVPLRRLATRLRRLAPIAATWGLLLTGTGLVLAGIAMIFVPAALITAGVAIFGLLTFDARAVRKLTWPR